MTSLRGIALVLNARGVRTARGGKWAATQIGTILARTGMTFPTAMKDDRPHKSKRPFDGL